MDFSYNESMTYFYLFMQKALERNDAGDHFPLYAICLGFEILTMIISKVVYPFSWFV